MATLSAPMAHPPDSIQAMRRTLAESSVENTEHGPLRMGPNICLWTAKIYLRMGGAAPAAEASGDSRVASSCG
jgi:hypothetical protein